MTLGGIALAVGILVDDATVEIENIQPQPPPAERLVQAILDGASQIAVPRLWRPCDLHRLRAGGLFISGTAKFLFMPLAMAVVFAMLAPVTC